MIIVRLLYYCVQTYLLIPSSNQFIIVLSNVNIVIITAIATYLIIWVIAETIIIVGFFRRSEHSFRVTIIAIISAFI